MCLAIPGQIEQTYEQDGLKMAKINFGGIRRAACLQYTPDARLGEYVLVHVGFAIGIIDAEQAGASLKFLEQSNELSELEQSPDLPAQTNSQGGHRLEHI